LTPTASPTVTPTASSTATSTPTPTPTPTLTPTQTPTQGPPPGTPGPACGQPVNTSGNDTTITVHDLGRSSGTVRIDWDAFLIEDRFEIFYEGVRIFDSPGGANGTTGVGFGTAPFAGTSTFVVVRVTSLNGSFMWRYTISCRV
jgi:hypothetical protein